jgi:hypothetical protein
LSAGQNRAEPDGAARTWRAAIAAILSGDRYAEGTHGGGRFERAAEPARKTTAGGIASIYSGDTRRDGDGRIIVVRYNSTAVNKPRAVQFDPRWTVNMFTKCHLTREIMLPRRGSSAVSNHSNNTISVVTTSAPLRSIRRIAVSLLSERREPSASRTT